MRALIAPGKPGEKSYKELVASLTAHLAPKPLLIAELYRFHKRDQKEGETIREYVANVKIPEVHQVPAVLLTCIVIGAEVTIMDLRHAGT